MNAVLPLDRNNTVADTIAAGCCVPFSATPEAVLFCAGKVQSIDEPSDQVPDTRALDEWFGSPDNQVLRDSCLIPLLQELSGFTIKLL